MNTQLTDSELVTLCGLIRVLVRLDGRISEEERQAIEAIGPALADSGTGPSDTYRDNHGASSDGGSRFWRAMNASLSSLPDDASVRQAALQVASMPSRQAIYGALYEIAASDTISEPEWSLLDWLSTQWSVSVEVLEDQPSGGLPEA